MSIELRDRGTALTASDLDELEELTGLPLPAEYRAFLAVHNGGSFNTDVVCDVVGSDREPLTVRRLRTIVRTTDGILVPLNEPPSPPETPTDGVILGSIAEGTWGRFYMGFLGDEAGSVWFVAADHGLDDWCFQVAYSFSEFLLSMRAPV